jgi:predicted dehydrogenase
MGQISRRDTLKGLIGIPILAYFANRFYADYKRTVKKPGVNWKEFGIRQDNADIIPAANYPVEGKKIRLGIVGAGGRGPQILKALGYVSEAWAEKNTVDGSPNTIFTNFLKQEDLNIEITGVCDTFSLRAEAAADIVASPIRSGSSPQAPLPRIYRTYREMLQDDKLDAIIVLTPDHWHAKMAMDAARAGKDVYLEKPMCQTVEEAKDLREVVRETGIILQVGHQNRQQASFIKGREMVRNHVLGPVSLIETFTNRNTDGGAWIRGIHPKANASNVNWEEFLGDKSKRELDLDRYFNWQKWFEYGTGPAGNQFTHEFDGVNQMMELGIPKSVFATGGNYYFKDPRDIPDVFNAIFHYPQKGLSLTYDCTLRNSNKRHTTIMGQDATLEASVGLAVYPDGNSSAFKEFTDKPKDPIFAYNPRHGGVDGVTSATTRAYLESGFGYTYHDGQQIDCSYLHLKEWLYCIRNGKQPSCNIDRGFEETATFYMANQAYLENRLVEWDAEHEKII